MLNVLINDKFAMGEKMNVKALVLAAGKGTRMKSKKPKVLFDVAGKPMIDYVMEAASAVCSDGTVVVLGEAAEDIQSHLQGYNSEFVFQKEQKGTADAVLAAKDSLKNYNGKILILCGDMPLVSRESLKAFIESSDSPVNFMSVKKKNPEGYGRVVRGADGSVIRIVEERDANLNEKKLKEINTGIYFAESKELFRRLENINNNNAQGEYYLTDIVKDGAGIFVAQEEDEFLGINDRAALAEASKLIWRKRACEYMKNGVSIIDPDSFYCDNSVEIENDVTIHPNVTLKGTTKIGEGSVVYPGCRIADSVVEDYCEIKDNCVITESFVGRESSVGPMAHLRPGSKLYGKNKIGNFVEVKKTEIHENSKASHLTYLGDAYIGKDVNIGCGTITCNYDGISKHKTIINDGVFVGSDVQFVAPVEIGKDALIAAGSTVTKDVPDESLAISRSDQVNKEGWVRKRKQIYSREK
ncbi:bifunctional UDP-N-acetylglucosamine diphosphorylase/glucosamine-1-phosphate N-acetyltransferase GlmU [Flexistipes sinusarabici]|uniref:bifunctional UDP-N-acetylglucosamine diphosphorylase/glucosamine-1-phosphate N-acetyltransferase GlmU n=1 Tax=Flexistipes sinusarabici TaxID=2352 RepID=UPI002356818D|nr:bifunctional UDP-N-acetylglucosamine diphosphorylase/glucosamine-1-phosphate N-acetyltransferase GlmU [Flexistipes sinusarabici]